MVVILLFTAAIWWPKNTTFCSDYILIYIEVYFLIYAKEWY